MASSDYKLASNISVIDRGMIEASSAQTVADILAGQVGVSIYDNGNIKSSTVDIRGFGDTANRNTLVLINDRRVNPADISGPDLTQIPFDSVERIEILRGAGSVLYGDNAVGGVVNIITKEGRGKPSATVRTTYGSYNARSVNGEISGGSSKLSYYTFAQYDDRQGYRDNSDVLGKDFNTRISSELTDKLKLSFATTWHQDNYGLPGALSSANLYQFGRKGSSNLSDFASTKDRSFHLTADIKPWPADFEWGHFVLDTSYRNRDTYADFESYGIATKRNIDTTGITAKYIFDQTVFDRKVNLVSGVDYYSTENDILGSGYSTDNLTITKDEVAGYVSGEFELFPDIFMTGGGRFQKTYYTFNQRNPAQGDIKQSPDETAGMVGARYEYAKGSNVFFNIQKTFRFLATDEWYDTFNGLSTSLKQQTGMQYEIGIKHNFWDVVMAHLTPYIIKLRNEIFLDPTQGGGFGSNNNYDRTQRQGIEFGQTTHVLKLLKVPHVDKIDFYTNYTCQNPEFDKGIYDGKKIPMAAQHQARAGIIVGFMDRFDVSLDGHYESARYAINDTYNVTAPIKPYFLLDSKLTYHLGNWEAFVSVNNLLSRKYYSAVTKGTNSTNKNYYPAPERSFIMGMSLKF